MAVGSCICLAICSMTFAVWPPPPEPHVNETAAERVRRLLEIPHNVDLQGLTFLAAVDALAQQGKVSLVLDRVAYGQHVGNDPNETPVQLRLHNAKLKNILKIWLGQYGLTYVIEQDAVVITTEEQALVRQVRQRVSCEFQGVPLAQALRQLARETATNVVLDPRQASKSEVPIVLTLDGVPLETAVRLVAELAGLKAVRHANVLFVTSPAVAADWRRDEDWLGNPLPAGPFEPGLGPIRFNPNGAGGGAIPPPVPGGPAKPDGNSKSPPPP